MRDLSEIIEANERATDVPFLRDKITKAQGYLAAIFLLYGQNQGLAAGLREIIGTLREALEGTEQS